MIPGRIENASVYLKGKRLAGIADAELPKFEYEADSIKSLGIAGEVEAVSVANLKPMNAKLKFRTVTSEAVDLLKPETQEIELLSAVSFVDPNTKQTQIKQLRVFMQATAKSSAFGKVEPGKVMDSDVELSCTYMVVELDGVKIVEFDPINWVFAINGTNYLEDVKYALGI